MAFDNLVLEKITNTLNKVVIDSYVDNVFALGEKQFALSFHGSKNFNDVPNGRGTLILYLDSERPFVSYSLDKYTKVPLNTPFFNALKKVIGTKITSIEKEKGERVITIKFKNVNMELGDLIDGYNLIIELFPTKPNLVLTTNNNNKIISSYKDFSDINSNRTYIRGLKYIYPKERKVFDKNINSFEEANGLLSTDVYKRLVELSKTTGYTQARDYLLDDLYLYYFNNNILPSSFKLDYIKRIDVKDIYNYFVENQKEQAHKLKTRELTYKINSSLKLSEKKLKNLNHDLKEANNKLIYKDYGNLLFLYQTEYEPKMFQMTLDGYTISLDPKKDVIQNANLYFKKYHKAKQAIVILEKLIVSTTNEIEYLKKVLLDIENGGNRDLQELKEELIMEGYLKDPSKKNKNKNNKKSYQPHILILPNNVRIGYGGNGLQNEELTFKISNKSDLFFHVKDYPGSHVLLLDGAKDDKSKVICASLALYLSKLDSGDVMVTERKNVKKNHEKVGLVNILSYETITIKKISNECLKLFKEEIKQK